MVIGELIVLDGPQCTDANRHLEVIFSIQLFGGDFDEDLRYCLDGELRFQCPLAPVHRSPAK